MICKRAEVLSRAGRERRGRGAVAGIAAPADEQSALAAAQAYQRLETLPGVDPAAGEARRSHPDQAATGFLLGAAYERTGQRDKAMAEFRRVLQVEPDFHAALNYLGYTFAEAGTNLDEALTLVSRAVALEPDNGAYVDSLGWTYYRLGRTEQARSYLERAARLSPRTRRCKSTWGTSMLRWGRRRGRGRPTSGRSRSAARPTRPKAGPRASWTGSARRVSNPARRRGRRRGPRLLAPGRRVRGRARAPPAAGRRRSRPGRSRRAPTARNGSTG